MLARKYRLPSSVVFQHPRSFIEKEFRIKAQKNDLSHNRYGFIVGKTIDKRAVVRNRLKRVVRSFIEKRWIENAAGFDILFILTPPIKDATSELIEEKIHTIMQKITI